MQAGALVPEAGHRHWGPLPTGSVTVLLSVRLCTGAGWRGAQTPREARCRSVQGRRALARLESVYWGQDRPLQCPELGGGGICRSMQRVWAVGGDRLAQRPFPARPSTQTPHGCNHGRPAGRESNILLGLDWKLALITSREGNRPLTGRVGRLLYLKFLTMNVY